MAKLYFYYAAMNAGKSATLLQSAHNYRERGMHTLLFTPKLDDRYGQGKITSRIGLQADATIFDREYDLFVEIRAQHMLQKVSCVLIDEARRSWGWGCNHWRRCWHWRSWHDGR